MITVLLIPLSLGLLLETSALSTRGIDPSLCVRYSGLLFKVATISKAALLEVDPEMEITTAEFRFLPDTIGKDEIGKPVRLARIEISVVF